MVGEVEVPSKDIKTSPDEDIKLLEEEFRALQEQTQDLINERAHMESEIRSLKKRANRLDEEVRSLKSPHLIVGHIEDILDQEIGIVRSSNGTVFQVAFNSELAVD